MIRNSFYRRLKWSLALTILFFPSLSTPAFCISDDSAAHGSLSSEELIRGERLFYGLVYQRDKSVNCAACHNTAFIDTLNWNPNAYEVSKKYLSKSADELASVLLKPRGEKMSEVHKNFDLTEADIAMLKGFMDDFAGKGLRQPKPVINRLIIFIFCGLLFLFLFTDLVVLKKIKRRWIHLAGMLLSAYVVTDMMVVEAIAIGRSPGYGPDQPIKFSHAIHAGENQTDCRYCHHSAGLSKSAGIPAASVCMNCHLVVRNGKNSGTFEIAKLIDAYENNIPIEWVRVYSLPDHAYFNHAQHTEAGGIDCAECHGKVEEMHIIKQYPDMSMGWCINCHRETKVDFLGNEFYAQYEKLSAQVRDGILDSVSVEQIGGLECMKCHY
jgi:cytochrome c553